MTDFNKQLDDIVEKIVRDVQWKIDFMRMKRLYDEAGIILIEEKDPPFHVMYHSLVRPLPYYPSVAENLQ